MPELDPVERAQTFEEVALGYSAEEAVNEARRCTQCPSKPCMAGCPVGVPIPSFIEQVALGNFARAYALVKSANSLPAICGRVCPQESQCEKRCTRGKQGEPVGIGRLERFTSDWAFEHPEEAAIAIEELREQRAAGAADASLQTDAGASSSDDAAMDDANAVFPDVDLSGKSVAVVGSGPASLDVCRRACQARVQRHDVRGIAQAGRRIDVRYSEFRLPKDLVARETSKLGDLGVTFAVNSVVGKLYDIDELLEERGFDAVFVGTGAGLPSYLNIEGEGLNGVSVASELLTRVNLMKAYRFPAYDTPVYAGKKCVVVGGGNVAMDAARTARRLGADVCVVYRRGREEMPARAEEIHHAEQEGIEFKLLTNPTRILGDENGWVSGVECVRMELGEPDASGRRRPKPVEGSEFVIDIDMLVIAAGSKTNPLIANTTPGLDVTTRSLIVADERTCATSKPGVFAGGDAVIGAATVILAMGAGKRAAAGIAEYLAPSA